MAGCELRLLGAWASAYMLRVRMVLEQNRLSYEYQEEDLSNKSELLLKHNPIHKKIPVLIHGDRSICESSLILQYIDENWTGIGPHVLPADPYERAMARLWAAYVDDKLVPALIGIAQATTEEIKAEKMVETFAALEHLEGALKKSSGGKEWFGGESIGFIDVTLGSFLPWINAVENISGVQLLDGTKVPLLVEWASLFLKVDFVKLVLPSVEKMEEYVRMLQATRWNVTSAK